MPKPTFEEAKVLVNELCDAVAVESSHRNELAGRVIGRFRQIALRQDYEAACEVTNRLRVSLSALIAGGSVVDGKFVAEGSEHHD